jgi:H+/Cl- antiporter ClcA
MGKLKTVAIIILSVLGCYGVLAVFISFVSDQTISTNQALVAAHNMAQYPGTSRFLLSVPWILWFVPAVIGIVLIVVVLRRQEPSY